MSDLGEPEATRTPDGAHFEKLAELLRASPQAPSLKRCYGAAHGSESDIDNLPPTTQEPLVPAQETTTGTRADYDEGDILDSFGDTEIARQLKNLLQHNIHRDLDTLYTVLSRQLRGCGSPHVLRLRLDGFCYKDHDCRKTCFQFYINSNHNGHPYTWVHCTMDRQWHNPPATSETTLCQHLATAEEKRKSLLISINPIVQTKPGKSDSNMVNVEPGWKEDNNRSQWTLQYVTRPVRTKRMSRLNESIYGVRRLKNLSRIQRYRLCFNLALSAFFLAGSSWAGARWCQGLYFDANIYFWPEEDSSRQRNITEAYLSCELHLQGPLSEEAAVSRRLQNLLELGKILFEAGFWETPRFLQRGQPHLLEETIRDKLTALVDQRAKSLDVEESFITAVKACIRPGRPTATTRDRAVAALSHEKSFRHYILSEILVPLARCARASDLIAEDPQHKPWSATTQGQQLTPLKSLPHSRQAGALSFLSQEFMADLDAFNNKYVNTLDQFKPLWADKFRVAIIDSGVCERDWEIGTYVEEKRIRAQRGFCGMDIEDCEDFLGHGTTVTKILLRAGPRAEACIAKVGNSATLKGKEISNICEAIDYAARIWDVDVINLSIALSNPSPDLDEVITKAIRSGKIFIVAAHGNSSERFFPMWPGRKDGVIAIHSIDGFSDLGYENKQDKKKGVYFAIPGRDIRVEEQFSDSITSESVYATGVSYVAPIAAGIAVSVLEILRHQAEVAVEDFKGRFCRSGFIKKVFQEMVKESKSTLNPRVFWNNITNTARESNGIVLEPENPDNIIQVLQSYVV